MAKRILWAAWFNLSEPFIRMSSSKQWGDSCHFMRLLKWFFCYKIGNYLTSLIAQAAKCGQTMFSLAWRLLKEEEEEEEEIYAIWEQEYYCYLLPYPFLKKLQNLIMNLATRKKIEDITVQYILDMCCPLVVVWVYLFVIYVQILLFTKKWGLIIISGISYL